VAIFSIDHTKITGLSVVVPPTVVSNYNLPLTEVEKSQLVKTIGIETRRVADAQTTAADMCIQAAEKLIEQLNWNKEDIDVLVFVTQTPDYIIPGSSMFMQQQLGLGSHCLALDVNQGCAGYVYGLSVISSLLSAGKLKKGLLMVGDTITKTIATNDISLTPVFSDAGSCTAIEYTDDLSPMMFNLQTDGAGFDKIIIKGGGARQALQQGNGNLYMNGQDIFNFGLRMVAPNVQALLSKFMVDVHEIDYFVMHQANLLLNEAIRKKLNIAPHKTLYSLKEYGNTSCVSIPVTLAANAQQWMNTGAPHFLLSGFGVGLSWGSVLVNLHQITCLPVHEYQ
jgi:3-oxoacyl-[acyl-carrier-protein] synthase-3